MADQSVNLKCTGEGFPKSSIRWLNASNHLLQLDGSYQVPYQCDSNLNLTFFCEAFNSEGNSTKRRLTVYGTLGLLISSCLFKTFQDIHNIAIKSRDFKKSMRIALIHYDVTSKHFKIILSNAKNHGSLGRTNQDQFTENRSTVSSSSIRAAAVIAVYYAPQSKFNAGFRFYLIVNHLKPSATRSLIIANVYLFSQ